MMKQTPAIFLSAALVMLSVACGASKQGSGQVFYQNEENSSTQRQDKKGEDERTKQVIDHLAETLSYSRYWFGNSGIDDVYVEGKQISALIFWTKTGRKSRIGFCSSDLSCCVSTSGDRLSPVITRMPIDRDITSKAAFESFMNKGIDGNTLKLPTPHFEPRPEPVDSTPTPIAPPPGNATPSTPTIPRSLSSLPLLHTLSPTDFEFEEKTITLPSLGLPASAP